MIIPRILVLGILLPALPAPMLAKVDQSPSAGELASNLRKQGSIAVRAGDLDAAEANFREALAIQERLAPESAGISTTLISLGNIALARGDLATAEERFRRALELIERLDPDGVDLAYPLAGLGIVDMSRGNLVRAEERFRRALAIREKLAPESLAIATDWINLGSLAERRGDLETAESCYRRALEIREKLAPASPDPFFELSTLYNLAAVEKRQGNLAKADEHLQRALEIESRIFPESYNLALACIQRANIAIKRGDLGLAEELHRRALAILERVSPESLVVSDSLDSLGIVALKRADLTQAESFFLRALAIREKLAPDSTRRGLSLNRLGHVYQRAGHRAKAAAYFCSATDIFDRQRKKLGGTTVGRFAFGGSMTEHYQDCLTVLIAAGLPEEAFLALERGRARSFLDLLAERDLASVRDPRPLDLAGARRALDPGTVLLSWSVHRERTFLFVVRPAGEPGPGLEVFQIPLGNAALRKEVEIFRRLLKHPRSERAVLQTQAQRLYEILIRPAEGRISGAQRILLSPDGPLHTLPFSALRRGDRYLAEWKPIHSVLSVTVYAELARWRPAHRKPGEERLAVFGDPVYPRAPKARSTSRVRDVLRGLSLRPLPASRKEVEAIAALYPQAEVYLGRDATEEKAKSLGPESRLVHFACHGLLDERSPLNSALALTLPERPAEGQENGLLQAWEIFESVRLDADLVTLSACDTALGREMGGEGLVGLTRAFQYAGARSVLASLWGVSDRSTADLMKRFYSHLKEGCSKDEALRAAQVDLIRGKSFAHPYHWAAFQLTGDWR